MAFQTLGVANSPLGRLISQGFDRRNQQQMQADSQAFQGGQNSLQRGNLRRMQDDRQKFEKEMDVLQYGRGKIQRERDKTTFANEQKIFGNQKELHNLQTEQIRGVRDSNALNDLIQQEVFGYGQSLYKPEVSNISMQDGVMVIPQQIKDIAGMSPQDMAQGLTTYMQGNKDLDLSKVQQRELAGKVNELMAGNGGGLFRKGLFSNINKDVMQDMQQFENAEPDEYSDMWEKALTPFVSGDFTNPFASDKQFLSQLEFTGEGEEVVVPYNDRMDYDPRAYRKAAGNYGITSNMAIPG